MFKSQSLTSWGTSSIGMMLGWRQDFKIFTVSGEDDNEVCAWVQGELKSVLGNPGTLFSLRLQRNLVRLRQPELGSA